jgi:tyrosyl-tRNA synthetase
MFQKRISDERDIYMPEMLYPVLQGYDSVMLKSDLTIVGSDQLFNEMMGRFYQERAGQGSQVIITTKITPGLDGKAKQSKSLNNYIALTEHPRQMFGKAMSMPDGQIFDWMRVYTDMTLEEIASLENAVQAGSNPRDAKIRLAQSLVSRYYGIEVARAEVEWFMKSFSGNAFPEDAQVVSIPSESLKLLELLGVCMPGETKSDLRRLIVQDAIELDGKKVKDQSSSISIGDKPLQLRVGKRRFFKVQKAK